jgi:NAD(P)-dependent dehydrogenase (short-subunit alcohol dehydrogenase family)
LLLFVGCTQQFVSSNAGIHFQGNGADGADKHTLAQWDKIMKVNVLSHVWAFQELLPHFRRQRQGRFLITASAAGLLTNLGDVSYSTTKHAAVGLAEVFLVCLFHIVC